jgi:putative DNA methylase
MTMTLRKKLIEVALPLDAINAASAREKSIRHGHPSTLHLWWSRKPLATARAILFAQLVDDPDNAAAPPEFVAACRTLTILTPGNDPKKPRNVGRIGPFATVEDTPRHRLFDFIAELVEWENTINEAVLKLAHELILLSTGGNPPPVLDPFSGGCTIPLEAQRLGLEAHGSDLNPVAVMIGKASIEIPPRFAGRPPVHPSEKSVKGGTFKGAQGLAADVRYYGAWMKERAQERVGHLYPKAKLLDGGEATVIAWLWARTIKCPNPACGADMQLVNNFDLSTKPGKRVWVQPEIDRKTTPPTVRYSIGTGIGKTPDPPKTGRGANFRCLCCGTSVDDKYVKAEGSAGRMGAQLMATVAEGQRSRMFLAPTLEMEAAAQVDRPDNAPSAPLPNDPRNFWTIAYGLDTFDKLFTPRQLFSLTTLSDLVAEAREQVKADALSVGLKDDGVPLRDGGKGAGAYAEAVGVYLAFVVSRLADFNSNVTGWIPVVQATRNTFVRQAIPMTWGYAEINLIGEWLANISAAVEKIANPMTISVPTSLSNTKQGFVRQCDVRKNAINSQAIILTA